MSLTRGNADFTELFVHAGWSAKTFMEKWLKICGEKLLVDSESFFKFRKKLQSCMTNECLTHKQLCNCDKNHLILKCQHLKLAIKIERSSDEYHLLLIPCVRKCKILVPSEMQLSEHLGLV